MDMRQEINNEAFMSSTPIPYLFVIFAEVVYKGYKENTEKERMEYYAHDGNTDGTD